MIIPNQKNFPEDYEEITQNEYRRLKRSDPDNYHGYTARLGFRYFKLIEKDRTFKNNRSDMKVDFHNSWAVISQEGADIALGVYPNARWDIIEQALKFAKEQIK